MLADNGQETIALHTNTGTTGYRVVKFEIIPNAPGTVAQETIKIANIIAVFFILMSCYSVSFR